MKIESWQCKYKYKSKETILARTAISCLMPNHKLCFSFIKIKSIVKKSTMRQPSTCSPLLLAEFETTSEVNKGGTSLFPQYHFWYKRKKNYIKFGIENSNFDQKQMTTFPFFFYQTECCFQFLVLSFQAKYYTTKLRLKNAVVSKYFSEFQIELKL